VRNYATFCAVVAHLKNHPEGQWTHEVAAAVGIPTNTASGYLHVLHRTGRVSRRMQDDIRYGKRQRYARWTAPPDGPPPENLEMDRVRYGVQHYAPDFKPDPDPWGEQERWRARVTAPKVRMNPWGRA